MVSSKWDWGFAYMFTKFGWKAILGILVANALYFAAFRKELLSMSSRRNDAGEGEQPVPPFITIVHLAAIVWTVLNAHYPALVIFGLLFFLAFVVATERHQSAINLRSPMLVGFFLAALVIHGGMPALVDRPGAGRPRKMASYDRLSGSDGLQRQRRHHLPRHARPGVHRRAEFAVVAGAIAGGGLTVIANAPNPAGQSILQSQFEDGGINPLGLLLAALIPTIIMGGAFMLLP